MSKYDLLPTKFKGDESDLNTVGIWVTKFTSAVSLLKLEGAESLDIFKLWIEGRAAQWQNEVEKLEDTKDWDLAKWTKRLSDYFSKSEKKVGNLITLSKFKKTEQESMSDFNDRFNKYLATIPKEHYTSDWIAKSYLETVSFIDRDLWWLISQDKNANDVKHLMAEASGGSKSQGCVQFRLGNEEANSRIDRVGTHPHLTSENGEEMLNEEFSSEVSEDSSEEDFEEVESGEESDSESNDDCENVPLFYSAIESSIMEAGIPNGKDLEKREFEGLETKMEKNKFLTGTELQQLNSLIKNYEEVFAFDYSQLPGIKNSEYKLQIPENLAPIGIRLRRHSPAEKEIIKKEIVASVKHFRCYLWNVRFLVYTDISAVVSLFKMKESSGRITRWVSMLTEFDFDIKHRSGKQNVVADYLSRPSAVVMLAAVQVRDEPATYDEIQAFLMGRNNEDISNKVIKAAKRYSINEGNLFRQTKDGHKKVIKNMEELHTMLQKLHDQLGHYSSKRIYDFVKTKYWRPKLYLEIQHYAKSCFEYQSFLLTRPLYRFDGRSSISGIFNKWFFDYLGPFPVSNSRKKYVLVAIEQFSGYPCAWAVTDQTAETTKKLPCGPL
ncbi:Retrovirus-related Pol polyprotein from transposon [Smittium culicis]|uniref:Retrovirus-related Pol polyprotein from transposon n=1 Tax=Smittium culicis TaxID=133412 RepID=A0A1R1X4J3_9FUNG|nr:Retrovirus-related Pol polyprotein from transposon [Smittium culicis]